MSSMSEIPEEDVADTSTESSQDVLPAEELAVENELLREQNRQLRNEYLRSQQQTYRRSAAALITVGLIAVGAGVVFPTTQTVFVALGGTGIFAGVLTYALTPERFIPETVSEGVYEAATADRTEMLEELGINGSELYLPGESPTLYLSATREADATSPPDPPADLSSLFVVTDDGVPGVALTPTGGPLFAAFTRSLTGELGETPATLAAQLTDGVVEGFGLADGVETDVDPTGGRLTVELSGVAYGQIDRLDHPVCSLFAVGLADGLDTPVRIEIEGTEPPIVTYRWNQDTAN